jgi:hypothetical protein
MARIIGPDLGLIDPSVVFGWQPPWALEGRSLPLVAKWPEWFKDLFLAYVV